jgi:di/tricarboxylate transporter
VESLERKFGIHDYLVEFSLLPESSLIGQRILDISLVKELDMEIIEVRRKGDKFIVPPVDFVLQADDVLKVRCNVEKIKALKDIEKIQVHPQVMVGNDHLRDRDTTLVELVVIANSELEGKTLEEVEFKRKYRAVPLAIRHREAILHEDLNTYPLQAGDVLLAEVKTHRLATFKRLESRQETPFIVVSEDSVGDFHARNFVITISVLAGVVFAATANLLPIMTAALLGAALLVLTKALDMRDVYESIDWKVIFLLAGALSLGLAMEKSGLASHFATLLTEGMGNWGPWMVLSILYLATSLLTNVISNNAAAALFAPIAIVTAGSLQVSPLPFLVAVTFAASASFMTPIGYQTNMMVYGAGQYRFLDFVRVGSPLNLLFWLLASLLIPFLFPF